MVCKRAAAVVLLLRAVREMRRAAVTKPTLVAEFEDYDDADADWRNY